LIKDSAIMVAQRYRHLGRPAGFCRRDALYGPSVSLLRLGGGARLRAAGRTSSAQNT
jgi:hypothetical protein